MNNDVAAVWFARLYCGAFLERVQVHARLL